MADINSKDEFIALVKTLANNLRNTPNDWGNRDLGDYLEAIAAWTSDMEGYYRNMGKPSPDCVSWQVLADILIAASVYE